MRTASQTWRHVLESRATVIALTVSEPDLVAEPGRRLLRSAVL